MDARLTPYVEKMGKTLVSLSEDFKTIRAGRANPAVLNKVRVEYYGSQVPISQVGNITVPEARILQIAPWEPNMVKAVIKAINMSDIGIKRTWLRIFRMICRKRRIRRSRRSTRLSRRRRKRFLLSDL